MMWARSAIDIERLAEATSAKRGLLQSKQVPADSAKSRLSSSWLSCGRPFLQTTRVTLPPFKWEPYASDLKVRPIFSHRTGRRNETIRLGSRLDPLPDTVTSRHNLAAAYQAAGRTDEARDLNPQPSDP